MTPSSYSWFVLKERVEDASGILLDLDGRQARSGGCINETYWVPGTRKNTDSPVFVKWNFARKIAMFEAEAEALSALAETGTIRVPKPLCHGTSGEEAFLALEGIEMISKADRESQHRMGRQLAALHQIAPVNGQFGWHRDNTIGELPQRNPWTESWVEFFGKYRLGVQFEMAAEKGRNFHGASELLERLPDLLAGREPIPSLLHGDLWGGNAAFVAGGEPVIYDPATYYGDRETDLAFTEFFGGFGPAFYEGYHAAWPLESGYDFRKQLYNLYHVLNHANHFGGGYVTQAESIIDRLISD